jgi:hypothetical protein
LHDHPLLDAQSRLHAAIARDDRSTASSLLAANFSSCDTSDDRPLARDDWLDVALALRLSWSPVDDIGVSDAVPGVTLVSGLFAVDARGAYHGMGQVIDLWTLRQSRWMLLVRRERPIPVHPSVGQGPTDGSGAVSTGGGSRRRSATGRTPRTTTSTSPRSRARGRSSTPGARPGAGASRRSRRS